MEYIVDKKEIKLGRKANKLDEFVLDFTSLLSEYVVVSGYVSILFGRSRATEDIDLLVPKIAIDEFKKLWGRVNNKGFECINTLNVLEAFEMLNEHAIRFARERRPVPNIEFKIIKNDFERYVYENKIKVIMLGKELFISPIEAQITYKLFLGSEKDLEDAKHLYELFFDKIDKKELKHLINKLKVVDQFNLIK